MKDLEMLLDQTQGTGVDVYTHSEMLPAHYYPFFKKYPNFAGNYGNAWWKQKEEFESFNGPILMTTNCLVPPKDSYRTESGPPAASASLASSTSMRPTARLRISARSSSRQSSARRRPRLRPVRLSAVSRTHRSLRLPTRWSMR